MRVVVLLALLGFMTAARTFHVDDGSESIGSGTALSVGYLLLTAFFLGSIFKQLRLPKLTGYLGAGLLAGASALDLLPTEALGDMRIFTGVAVALIALTAGCELEVRAMKPLLRTIKWLTLVAVIGTALLLGGAVYLMRGFLPFMEQMTMAQAVAVSLVLGVVMSAQSPAVVVALRTEMAADGPICRTVLGVVVIADLVVIVLFAATSTVARSVFGGGAAIDQTILHLMWELGGSIVAGIGIGSILAVYLRGVGHGAPLFVLMIAFVTAEVGQRIGLDPLLVALAAGVLIRNGTDQGDVLHHAIEGSSLPVYLVFFAVAGATIHLDVLAVVGLPAVLFVLIRAAGFLAGSRIACAAAGAAPEVRKWVGFGLLPQAGLALALSMLFSKTFPEFGADAGALTLGIVALNEMVSPVIYRYALVRSGEAGATAPPGSSMTGAPVPARVNPSLVSGAYPTVGGPPLPVAAPGGAPASGEHPQPRRSTEPIDPPAEGSTPGAPKPRRSTQPMDPP